MNLLLHLPQILAQASDLADPIDRTNELSPGAAAAAGIGTFLVMFVIYEIFFALMWWKVLQKAGKPGWVSIVPIYNVIVLWQITGKPAWLLILTLIPCTSPVGWILLSIAIAERFGKSAGFGIGLAFLSVIFYPILGFGDARYLGPEGPAPSAPVV